MAFSYTVPGMVPAIAQDGPMTCWATVYTMMISWRRSFQMPVRAAVNDVAPKYAQIYDQGLRSNPNPRGLPSAEFGPFLNAAHMSYEPMRNTDVGQWYQLMQDYGLLWVGTLNSVGPGGGLHSRIITGLIGEGNHDDTHFAILDPDRGRRYFESFGTFVAKYEGALSQAEGQYLQIRHF